MIFMLSVLAKFCQIRYRTFMATMNVSLPDDLKSFVDEQVAGRYSTSSEYVRELIRREQDRLIIDVHPTGSSRGRRNLTYGEVFAPDEGTEGALRFALFLDGKEFPVTVSRGAMDDYAAKVGIRVEDLAHGYVEFLEMYQPEFALAAAQRVRSIEAVAIVSSDGVGF
jgi:hypothetical protein